MVVQSGADAIGLVFYEPSPRAVDVCKAQEIAAEIPPFVTIVGLFVNAQRAYIESILNETPVDILQFHGDEQPDECSLYGKRYIKAISMRDDVNLQTCARDFSGAAGLLVDTYHQQVPGGSGEVFDWNRIPAGLDMPIILAGGLTPENVSEAISHVHPYAVDVSSGVEQSKGIKDQDKISAFMRGVARVESNE